MDCRMLVVEDSAQIREAIYDFFVAESGGHFTVDLAGDGMTGLEMARKNVYDIVILDIMLPGVSGFDICKAIRSMGNVPIIFLTALGTEDNILRGYELGGDEYVVKPFSLKVLYAKVLALLNRSRLDRDEAGRDTVIRCGMISMNTLQMQVYVNDVPVELPPKEYFLLKAFLDNKGNVLTREVLLDRVWGTDFDGVDRVVDNQIRKLRADLGAAGKQIKTVFGMGYKITGD